jgi:hypothetical protein
VKPTEESCSTVRLAGKVIVNTPSALLTTALEEPLTTTETPGTPELSLADVTFPVTVRDSF